MRKYLFSLALVALILYPMRADVRADVEPPLPQEKAAVAYKVWVTAYSSTPEETDDTPFITASGKEVRDGIVAANFFPFGTRVQIPALFGEKVFVVEDRMHRRKTSVVDVWMRSKADALRFGAYFTEIIVLE